MIRIKICGITTPEAARVAAEAGADAIGLVFAPSRRRVSVEEAKAIVAALPPFVSRVGVFVNEAPERIAAIADACGLDVLQLHGDEPPEACRWFPRKVIKAIRVRGPESLESLARYEVDAFLLDTFVQGEAGGTGRTFDWEIAKTASAQFRVILSGGLTPENVREALELVRPYGVDVSSGVETDGSKDPEKIRAFIAAVREWEHRRVLTPLMEESPWTRRGERNSGEGEG
ncbi:MAG: phosphoribosylanthranilate isomerase [Armatimonadota bacterium]|nr:phosphoribosylanthranilate isomerase [Armatimonadota bacterium]